MDWRCADSGGLALCGLVRTGAAWTGRAIVDGYGPDEVLRRALPALLTLRAQAMHDMLADAHRDGRMPWARMYKQGHGAFWAAAAAWIRQREHIWQAALRT